MYTFNRFALFAFAAALGLAPLSSKAAERPDRDRGNNGTANSHSSGACTLGSRTADLDVNNIRARMYNTGGLFWRGGNPEYEAPRGSGLSPIFASGLWIGGQVNGVTRFAGADYSDWEYYPGPLDNAGNPPADCSEFDRFWKVNRTDIENYNATGIATQDLLDWPIELGAPVFAAPFDGIDNDNDGLIDEGEDGIDNDGDGSIDERDEKERSTDRYDLVLGDRPDIIADQSIWWVMNDVGGPHNWGLTPAIGVEVRVQAFAFATSNAINNTTFYIYDLLYKGSVPLENAFLGLWSDPDLGDAGDDYVGSDTTLGLGFVYNSDNEDGGSTGYGLTPPALGYDFFQGPIVDGDGIDNNGDGTIDEPGERLGTTKFLYYNNDQNPVNGNPANGEEAYNYLRGIWREGSLVTEGGDGTDQNNSPADFMFPGDPGEFWSEGCPTPACAGANTAGDRRFLISSGPFTINPGDVQQIVFGIVYSRASGGDQNDSVRQLKVDDALAQSAFDNDFEVPRPPDAPVVTATPLDGAVALTWENSQQSNNYLNSYDVFNPFSDPAQADRTYTLEGYEIYSLTGADQLLSNGTLLGVVDVSNGITTVTDVVIDPTSGAQTVQVVARGTDAGLRNSFTVTGLSNNQNYFLAVRAYAYNEGSSPEKIYASPITFGTNLVQAIPSFENARNGGTIYNSDTGDLIPVSVVAGDVRSPITARVVDPSRITGDSYDVNFFNTDVMGTTILTFDIVNTTTGETMFDGDAYAQRFGRTPISSDQDLAGNFIRNAQVPIVDGIEFTAFGLTEDLVQVFGPSCGESHAAEALIDFSNGRSLQRVVFENLDNLATTTVPDGTVLRFYSDTTGGTAQASTFPLAGYAGTAYSFVEQFGPGGTPACSGSGNQQGCAETGGVWVYANLEQFAYELPAAVNMGANSTGIYHATSVGAGPEDPTSLPAIAPDDMEIRFGEPSYGLDVFSTSVAYEVPFTVWNIGDVQPGEENDPSDDVQYIPAMFSDFSGGDGPTLCSGGDGETFFNYRFPRDPLAGLITDRVYSYPPLTTYAAFEAVVETELFPYQDGTVLRINTADFAAVRGDADTAVSALDLINVSPNPYRARSPYETNPTVPVARFINLPETATIRVFTLAGTLVRTLEKTNPAVTTIDWDLKTERGLPIASGMYLIHVDAPGVGEKVIKFGVIQRRSQLDIL